MFCKNCGREINDSKFCMYCGTRQENDIALTLETKEQSDILEKAVEKKQKNKNKSKNIKGILFVCVLLGILIFIGMGLFWWMGRSKSNTFLKMLKEGRAEAAKEYYDDKLVWDAPEVSKAYEASKKEIDNIVSEYYDNTILYDDAVEKLNIYSEFYIENVKEAEEKIDTLKASRDAFQNAETAYNEQNYQKVYEEYQKVIIEDENYEEARSRMAESYNVVYQQIKDTAAQKASEGKLLDAVEYLSEQLMSLNAEDRETVTEEIQKYKEQYAEQQWESIKEVEDYEQKYTAIFQLEEEIGNIEVLRKMKEELDADYEDYIIAQVNSMLETRNLENAMQLIYAAEKHIAGSTEIQKLKDSIKDYNPVSILDLEPYAIGRCDLDEDTEAKDNMGNIYESALEGYYENEAYNIYDIGGKYNILTGTVCITKGSIGTRSTGYIKIYGDDILLWEDTNITANTKSYDRSVNVSGVTDLKIEMCGRGKLVVMLCNPVIQK